MCAASKKRGGGGGGPGAPPGAYFLSRLDLRPRFARAQVPVEGSRARGISHQPSGRRWSSAIPFPTSVLLLLGE
eukprot:9202333-Pyramimonas_sp.AAC.1